MTKRRFGEFELDEQARSLTLRGAPVAMQPLVFNLLCYLVRHAGRVVPKSELMEVLWPNLHVTEASLQRAVSLARATLRAGGLDSAIRNVVRFGYRFALDRATIGQVEAAPGEESDKVASARRAADERQWGRAAAEFAEADRARQLGPDDLDLWSYALECHGRMTEAMPLLARAVEGHVVRGAPNKAALSATRLSKVHFENSEIDVARAWLVRAEELLSRDPPRR